MGSVINQVNNVLTRFIGKIIGFQAGGFEIGHGKHELTVPIDITPTAIWASCLSYGTDGCGQFPVNKVGTLIGPNQIIFIVDIETETAHVKWFATDAKNSR